jgi:hypothetical protein
LRPSRLPSRFNKEKPAGVTAGGQGFSQSGAGGSPRRRFEPTCRPAVAQRYGPLVSLAQSGRAGSVPCGHSFSLNEGAVHPCPRAVKPPMAGISKSESACRAVFLRRCGEDLRQQRLAAGLSLQAVADVFGRNRDFASKVEKGQRNLSLYDYLVWQAFLRPIEPNHAAHALAHRLLPPTLAPRR